MSNSYRSLKDGCRVYLSVFLIGFTEELIEDEELFPDDALSNHHTDMVDNEPVINEAKKSFMRYRKHFNFFFFFF